VTQTGYFIPDKEYFNIGEASRVTQVPSYTLRYWETALKVPRPVRRASGHRRYTRRDLESIFKIKELLYDRKLTVAGARKALHREARAQGAGGPDLHTIGRIKRELREILLDLSK
jgi:DNA-binding transcriptional MerR regulator